MKIKVTKKARYQTAVEFLTVKQAENIDEFKGKPEELVVFFYSEGQQAIYVGLGDESSLQLDDLRKAAATAIKKIQNMEKTSVSLHVPKLEAFSEAQMAQALTEGASLGAYSFDKYKTISSKKVSLKNIEIVAESSVQKAVLEGEIISSGIKLCSRSCE